MHATEFVESYFDAWNHHDPKGIADHLTDEGIYLDIPENRQQSHDELIVSLNKFFNQFQHHYELIGEILSSETTIAFQYRINPYGYKKSNSGDSYQGAEFMTLNGEAAMVITDYYDFPVRAMANKYAKSGLTDHQLQKYKQQLNLAMRTNKAYLKPDLTLPKLAEIVGCSINHLSQVINSGFGTTFFEYLNRYRIEHARELLARPNKQSDAILNIAFAVGFNSNSAFYSAFKKRVGVTPAQYRRKRMHGEE
jgi:AraC-like DNA-binding protein